MSTFDDDRLDALLRAAMQGEAETVTPAGDGLSKIQQRVTTRRARWRFLRPALVLGTATAMAAVGVGAYAIVHNPGGNAKVVVPPATTAPGTPTESSSPSPSQSVEPVVNTAFPKLAIFPFVNPTEAKNWEKNAANGSEPWAADPKAVAQIWVQNILQLPSVDTVLNTKSTPGTPNRADVTLGRTLQAEGQKPFAVTVVHLVQYGHAWIVVGASDGGGLLKISSPTAGSSVSSPVSVSGPGFGNDEAAQVQVRDAESPTTFGHNSTGSFGVQGWSASVRFHATGSVGAIAVVEASKADEGPARLAVEQVRFGATSVSAAPPYFYGIKNGRVTKFHSSDGAAVSYLTSGGGASDPQLSSSGEVVYYLTASGTCANALKAVNIGGGQPHPVITVATPDSGYRISGYSVGAIPAAASGAQRPWLGYFEQSCNGGSPAARLVTLSNFGHRHVVNFSSMPPAIVGDPSFEPAGNVQHLDAIVRTGNQAYLARYNAASGNTTTPASACPGADTSNGLPQALETDFNGTMWFAVQTGSSMQVWKCAAGSQTAVVAFTIAGNRTPADVDVSGSGAVLVTDIDGHVWRWNGSGNAVQLSPSVPLTQVTW